MFKKTLISTVILTSVMSAAPVFSAAVTNKDFGGGTISFHGSVTEAPCSIVPGDEKLDVNLGTVSQKLLNGTDKGSVPVDIKIHLNSCQFETTPTSPPTPDYGQLSKVAVVFDNYNSPDHAKGLLHNDGTAGNVNIQLMDNEGNPVNFDTSPTKDTAHQLTGSTGEISLKARMLSDGTASTPGTVTANVTYKLKYF
ncbi:long polar fimbrial protein LpfA [Salmonella enterica]|nr:long polar fimbrial protein LpfA [Salmonella enterica]